MNAVVSGRPYTVDLLLEKGVDPTVNGFALLKNCEEEIKDIIVKHLTPEQKLKAKLGGHL